MIELETIKELKDYEMLASFKQRAFFGKDVYHYLYKGLFNNVHISYCDFGIKTSWVASYGVGDTEETFLDKGIIYNGYSKFDAIEKTKDILGRAKEYKND